MQLHLADLPAPEALDALNDLIELWAREYWPALHDAVPLATLDERLDTAVYAVADLLALGVITSENLRVGSTPNGPRL